MMTVPRKAVISPRCQYTNLLIGFASSVMSHTLTRAPHLKIVKGRVPTLLSSSNESDRSQEAANSG